MGSDRAASYCTEDMLKIVLIGLISSCGVFIQSGYCAPGLDSKSWPPMKSYDIWETQRQQSSTVDEDARTADQVDNNYVNYTNYRNSKVLNFFPVPVDDECLADDGRRSGICLNVYECRLKGGAARGDCALGFGVCCVFIASCDQEISHNITYLVSPSFPSAMSSNLTSCKVKIKMMSPDISQLRIDFFHFSLGQPNRKTGVCDGDIFQVSGGIGGSLTLCGQNSGQHVYYDVGGRVTGRQDTNTAENSAVSPPPLSPGNLTTADIGGVSSNFTTVSGPTEALDAAGLGDVEILMNFTSRFLPTRLWEIRVVQIPFSQRAPAGCLQYFTGNQGVIQTFNFADNGRHLANQDYRSCIRQEVEMCTIVYEPCDGHSFRIGPTNQNDELSETVPIAPSNDAPVDDVISPEPALAEVSETPEAEPPLVSEASEIIAQTEQAPVADVAPTEETAPDPVQADNPDEIEEGSGGGDAPAISAASAPPAPGPVRGGFDIFSFFRNTFFDFRRRRKSRQFFNACTDRITLPCIIEDFIGAGMGTLPDCEPVHCGDKFCSSSSDVCRIESTVTPFHLGIHFGNGIGKGSPEENIGACLKYTQMPCL